jgi:hypothetical protein
MPICLLRIRGKNTNQGDLVIKKAKKNAATFFTKLFKKHGVVSALQQEYFIDFLYLAWLTSTIKTD